MCVMRNVFGLFVSNFNVEKTQESTDRKVALQQDFKCLSIE